MSNRARSDAQKRARREQIVAVAVDLLAAERYDGLTMAAIAKACGVAKGTLYLYFPSKEALFLTALEEEYVGWLAATDLALAELPTQTTPPVVANAFVDVLSERSRFLTLMGLVHGVLEENTPLEALVQYKRTVLGRGLQTAMALHGCAPWVPPDEAPRFLLRVHALLTVVTQLANPAPVTAEALQRPELAALNVDLDDEMRGVLTDLLTAIWVRTNT